MNLLQIDHNLFVIHSETNKIFNITDNLVGNIIRKIIFGKTKVVILTSTKVYYIFFNEKHYNFEIIDLTCNITKFISINNIKFIGNTYLDSGDFHMVTYDNKIFCCYMHKKKFCGVGSVQYEFVDFSKFNIVAVSSENFSIICEDPLTDDTCSEKGYYIGEYKNNCIKITYSIDCILKQFTSVHQFTTYNTTREIVPNIPKMIGHEVIIRINNGQRILLNM